MRSQCISESALRWLEVILSERIGQEVSLNVKQTGLILRFNGGDGCIYFDVIEQCLRESRSDLPYTSWEADSEGWASLLGGPLPAPGVDKLPKPLIEKSANGYVIHYDILGLVYWMLARVEEIGRADLDNHERFPASSSHAYKHDYLERPVVDEWLDVLKQVIRRQWPSMELKKHQFSLALSHDVDRPSRYLFGSPAFAFRAALGDVLRRRDVLSPFRAARLRYAVPHALHPSDPYNTFEWLMDLSETKGTKSTFYFMAGRSNRQFDVEYDIRHPAIRKLLNRIHKRGHDIGLHPSYESYRNPELLRIEAHALIELCHEEGICQGDFGARMHYLRWRCEETPHGLAAAGLSHDSTPGYADRIGYRCGTAFAYPFFDARRQQTLHLRMRPLAVMDQTLCSPKYMNLGLSAVAANSVQKVKSAAICANGICSILWHNSSLSDLSQKRFYMRILE